MAGAEPLLDLMAECVVEVHRDGRFEGTGFFVAPGEVLTCAHVVHGGRPVTVVGQHGTFAATPSTPLLAPDDPRAGFYPQPDAALLRVDGAPPDQPCVRLERDGPAVATDRLQLIAFTSGEHAPGVVVRSGAALHLETVVVEEGCALYKLREGQVIGGFSGGPLLNVRTGGVCALIDSSRSETSDLGGFGVPVAEIEALDPGLLARNAAASPRDGVWARVHHDQLAAAAERAGQRELLPLLPPVVELEHAPDLPPSDLLRPRFAVVPFVARGALLDHLMLWRERQERLSVLVLTGAGGFGKTRTAAEVCLAAEAAGWTAGLLAADGDGPAGLTSWPGRLLVVVDYAETRPPLVTDLLARLLRRRGGAPCRVVLVVRQGGARQALIDLFAAGDARDDVAGLLRRGEWVRLEHAEQELDRRALFTSAARAFAARRGSPADLQPPDLSAAHFERPLFVLAAALLRVDDPGLDVARLSDSELIGELLDRHEAEYWRRSADRAALRLHPDDQAIAVSVAALCGLSGDEADQRLIRLVPALRDAQAERLSAVVRWLRGLYGPAGSLEPDLLAEVLVGRTITATPSLLDDALDAASDAQLTQALVVLSRVAYRSAATRYVIEDALDARLPDLVRRVLRGHSDLVTAFLLAVGASGPARGAWRAQEDLPFDTESAVWLGTAIGELSITGMRLYADSDPEYRPNLAVALTRHGSFQRYGPRPADGLAHVEEALGIFRELARLDPARWHGQLGWALDVMAVLFAESGRPLEGLVFGQEAVGIFQELVPTQPQYAVNLALALNNLGMLLRKSGRYLDGLGPAQDAVSRCRELVRADPDKHRLDLAAALETYSGILLNVTRPADGLPVNAEAVRELRTLVIVDPGSHLPELAETLNTRSMLLDEIGRPADALAVSEEAVRICRGLVAANAPRHRRDLAAALVSLAWRLSSVGRPAEALAHAEAAVDIYRVEADHDEQRNVVGLARALVAQASILGYASRPVDGLAAAGEAIHLLRELLPGDTTGIRPLLAHALGAEGDLHYSSGHPEDAVPLVEEVIDHYRLLASTDPHRFLSGLAEALVDLAGSLTWGDSLMDAVAAAAEGIATLRRLVRDDPDAIRPVLARGLAIQALALGRSELFTAGIRSATEGVAIWRELADADPTRLLDVTQALKSLSVLLQSAGRAADALEPALEAVVRLKGLTAADERRFLPDFADAVRQHADVLGDLGRVPEAAAAFQDAFAAYSGSDWSRGVLLAERSRWHADNDRTRAAVEDAIVAARLLDGAGDSQRRAESRQALRALHQEDPGLVLATWQESAGEPVPVWLRLSVVDDETGQLLVDWMNVERGERTVEYLTEHEARLLTDDAEAGLEHLVDDNVGNTVATEYLALLRSARANGIASAAAELYDLLALERAYDHIARWANTDWSASAEYLEANADELLTDVAMRAIAAEVPGQPQLLVYHGLLGLSRTIGIERAYAMLSSDPTAVTDDPPHDLDAARLRAGLAPDSADAQLDHALVALRAGVTAEAEWAITRFQAAGSPPEREALLRKLERFADAHANLDVAPLRRIIDAP